MIFRLWQRVRAWLASWFEYRELRLTLYTAKEIPAGRHDLAIVNSDSERVYVKIIEGDGE